MTKTEQKIYDAIVEFKEVNGTNPTMNQMRDKLGYTHRAAIEWHISNMIEKDILTFPPGRPSKELIIKIKK